MNPVTIQDIASKAGVSTATVSRCLRNAPSQSRATCARIQALAKEMGYCPDPLISALVNRRWRGKRSDIGTIAWVTTFATRDVWRGIWWHRDIFAGAEKRALSAGYHLEDFWLGEPGMTQDRLSNILYNRGIRGLFVASFKESYECFNMAWEHFSCAAIDDSHGAPNLHRASPHYFQGIALALHELYQAGYRKIGFWVPKKIDEVENHAWLAGVLLFREQHPDVRLDVFLMEGFGSEAEVRPWLRKHHPEAVLAYGDYMLQWLEKLSPKTAGATMTWSLESPYPGIDQNLGEIGKAAIDLIIGQIRRNETGIPAYPRIILIDGEWKAQGNSGKSLGSKSLAKSARFPRKRSQT